MKRSVSTEYDNVNKRERAKCLTKSYVSDLESSLDKKIRALLYCTKRNM